MLLVLPISGSIGINNIVGTSPNFICCHVWITLSAVWSAYAVFPIEPVVERLLVNTETTFTEPNHPEILSVFAKIIRFANAYAKDFRHLFSSVGALTEITASIVVH